MRKFAIKYIIPVLFLSFWSVPALAATPGGAYTTSLSKIVLIAFYVTATFMIFMGMYQIARGFADEEFSRNKRDGLVFMVFGVIIFAVAVGHGVVLDDTNAATFVHESTVLATDTSPGNSTLIHQLSAGLLPIAEAVILWGVIHYIIAFTKDGLEEKHKGVLLIACGILLALFGDFATTIITKAM